MKVLAINGSPRKTWNTATLLKKALEGAASQGAVTELVHLYDLTYKGCTSCFACKMIGGPSNGRCAMQDELRPILEKIETEVDALILGSPIYFGQMSGEMRSFFERLLFAPLVYSQPPRSIFPRTVPSAVILTMNVTEELSRQIGYEAMFNATQGALSRNFGTAAEILCCFDTCQFADYSKVVMEYMDPAHKMARRTEAFPEDCQRAFALGARLAGGS
ncbi:NADPH-dependent FMN reductase [Desulfobulbus propionicus DSM 2032]|mgnify:CR=1 FL=1|uniref:NADPH-dependent FMN reductase n=1 Tax=Desulfobulbus propionicus (strain ATCC 33891 / DSM 2032 / VKM B-1956 / 1pr3) TaxID=577650 RepID=A0A7U3YL09_DESPD|nr:flavodoxin family protein [Desulfobulbus propionicus]ADW17325.1 NADPH-dependent FMN reductase [Desulfobulbus propionicus DSM 2032]